MNGLSKEIVESLNLNKSIGRIRNDIQTDFIFAPHLNIVYHFGAEDLTERFKKRLLNNEFDPLLPITIEVPKSSGFSRPGSILWPIDRLAYQVAVDSIAEVAEKLINRNCVYSNVLSKRKNSNFMFESSSIHYYLFKSKLGELSNSGSYSDVLKADIASFFERLNQHVLINLLGSCDCEPEIVSFLEYLLSSFKQRYSYGIIQGVYPSDFLGNFYLCAIDSQHDLEGLKYIRYVDDIFVFFDSEIEAKKHIINLGRWLRREGLDLNELKTKIYKVKEFITEETEMEIMFEEATKEIEGLFRREDFYDSIIYWDEEFQQIFTEEERSELEEYVELKATKKLFDLVENNIEKRNKIDKFCIPIFTANKDDHGIEYVLRNFIGRPDMSQIYGKYLKELLKIDKNLGKDIEKLLFDKDVIFDFQIMWLFAILMGSEKVGKKTVRKAVEILRRLEVSETVRATCAIFCGLFGDAAIKRILRTQYEFETSIFVKAAILYSARNFANNEKRACFRAWGGHNEINSLIVSSIKSYERSI
ncbi:MAG: RNA-directed DNA polymerase [Candidatus Hodarchaeales archaeon]|jgi:hypothetical protein